METGGLLITTCELAPMFSIEPALSIGNRMRVKLSKRVKLRSKMWMTLVDTTDLKTLDECGTLWTVVQSCS